MGGSLWIGRPFARLLDVLESDVETVYCVLCTVETSETCARLRAPAPAVRAKVHAGCWQMVQPAERIHREGLEYLPPDSLRLFPQVRTQPPVYMLHFGVRVVGLMKPRRVRELFPKGLPSLARKKMSRTTRRDRTTGRSCARPPATSTGA